MSDNIFRTIGVSLAPLARVCQRITASQEDEPNKAQGEAILSYLSSPEAEPLNITIDYPGGKTATLSLSQEFEAVLAENGFKDIF